MSPKTKLHINILESVTFASYGKTNHHNLDDCAFFYRLQGKTTHK